MKKKKSTYKFFEITRNEFWRGNCAYILLYLGNLADNDREKSDLSVKEIGILLVNLIYKKKNFREKKNKKKVYWYFWKVEGVSQIAL